MMSTSTKLEKSLIDVKILLVRSDLSYSFHHCFNRMAQETGPGKLGGAELIIMPSVIT